MNPACYTRPAKPLRLAVTRRPRFERTAPIAPAAPVIVDRATECHVTPPDVAARMLRYLGAPGATPTLEPSAGTGNLSRALLTAGHTIYQVERHHALAGRLADLGPVDCACFLEWSTRAAQYDRIIMNPPFSTVRAHMAAAQRLLAPGGVLVALVPVTYPGDALEVLPDDTFRTARVNTKIIRIAP